MTSPKTPPKNRRTNFVLIMTDQHRADHVGCYGNREVQTPHIDALARKGCRFDDFHVATPVCQPNRASLLTGRLPSAHGLQLNGRELSFGETSFVEVLRQAGWRTALAGKAHLQNITGLPPVWPQASERLLRDAQKIFPGQYGQENAHRWEHDSSFELTLPYYGFEKVALTIGHADEQQGHWRRWLNTQVSNADSLIGPSHAIPTPDLALGKIRQAWRTRLPEALYPTTWIADQTCALLREFSAGDAPFFLQCSFPDPHHPFTPPGRYWDMFRAEDVTLPPSFYAELYDPPPPVTWLHQARKHRPTGPIGYASFACSEQEAREALALNYGSIALIDHAIGQVLHQIETLGLTDETVILFTSDHGELLADRGLMFKGGLHYTALTRVPFIWCDTPAQRTHLQSSVLAQTIDIAPTILERAGVQQVHGMQGRSLLSSMTTTETPVRDALLIEEEGQRRDFGLPKRLKLRTLRTQHHRLTIYAHQPWGELYDLQNDPLELRNLWHTHPELRHALGLELAHLMLTQTDESPYPEAPA